MAYAIQTAFGAGEYDPALQERTTLEKYKTGLKTLRNAYVGKTGGIISRPGTVFDLTPKRSVAFSGYTFTTTHASELATTASNHNYPTGLLVRLTTTGTLPAGYSLATDYYVVWVSANTLRLATSKDGAFANTYVTITDDGSGTHTITPTDLTVKECILYAPPYTDYLIEWGDLYVRIHDVTAGTYEEGYHPYTESDLPYVHFSANNEFVYIAIKGKEATRMVLGALDSSDPDLTTRFVDIEDRTFRSPRYPYDTTFALVATGAPTGYAVRYLPTFINGKEECPDDWMARLAQPPLSGSLPVLVGEYNTITVVLRLYAYQVDTIKELRLYRQPTKGQAYGFIGSTTSYSDAAAAPYTDRTFTFIDYGQTADYTNLAPRYQADFDADTDNNSGIPDIKPDTLFVYQQRLAISGTLSKNKEASFVSRPGALTNFLRDYPLSSESALAIRAGTTGTGKVLRYFDLGGLAAFTTQGIYMTPTGPLTDDSAYMIRRSGYVIDDRVPPLEIPGAVIFVERSTNCIISIVYSDNEAVFKGTEISIYSNHLFDGKRVISWAFQEGVTPIVWVVLDDGTLNILTYQNEQLLRAWSHADTDGLFKSVAVSKTTESVFTVYFVVYRESSYFIETLADRHPADIKDFIGMDSTVTYKEVLEATFTLAAVTPGDYEGPLTLTASSAVFANTAGNGAVGTIFRWFHEEDGHSIDLEVTAYTSTTVLTVQPSTEFPHAVEDLTFTELYKTTVTVTGLDHLEGKNVSVLLDGFVEASPYNFQDNHNAYTVSGGSITLENRGAVVHVGLPYAVDIETLDVETVEQKPTLLESILCNKVEVKIYKSRGFWVGQKFPDDDSNEGLQDSEFETQEEGDVSLATKPLAPYTKREEVIIEGNWESKGRIAIRQVDPLPLGIISIIPDIDVQYKS
jgi:hypothetical protein